MKKRKIASPLLLLLFTSLFGDSEGAASVTLTDDSVLSGSSATLTCTIDPDGGTVTVVKWKDSDGSDLPSATESDGYTITTTSDKTSSTCVQSSVSADTTLTCWALIGGTPYEDTGLMDVVSIAAGDNAILTGGTSTISCTLSDSTDSSNPTVTWTSGGATISDNGTYTASTDFTGSDKIGYLAATSVTTDTTFTCTFDITLGGSVEESVELDYVTITVQDDVIASGDTASLTCVLSDASSEPGDFKWKNSSGDEITTGGDYIAYTYPSYSGGSQTDNLQVSNIGATTTFTCCYLFGSECTSAEVVVDYISQSISDVLVLSGSDTTLTCYLSNSPSEPSAVTWKTSSGTVTSGVTEGSYSGGAQTTTLAVTGVTEDTTYTCQFTIDGADVKDSATVQVVEITATSDTALLGDSVTLSCEISGAQLEPSAITWTDSTGTEQSGVTDDSWESGTGSKLSKLTVANLASTATYTCIFTVDSLNVSSEVSANIINIASTGTYANEDDDDATITCILSNSPSEPEHILWKDSDADAITSGSDGYTITDGVYSGGSETTVLDLNTAALTADKNYTCVFVIDGEIFTETVEVEHVSITTTASVIQSGDTATLSCELGDLDSDVSDLTAVQWYISSTEQTSSTAGTTVTSAANFTTTQLVSTSTTTDTDYTCIFTFTDGSVKETVTVDVVVITATGDINQNGETASITCALTACETEPSAVSWSSAGSDISTGGDYTVLDGSYDSSADTQTMSLEKANVDASATFTCTFTIDGSTLTDTAEVQMVGVTATGHTITSGSSTNLTCVISDFPSAPTTISWTDSTGSAVSSTEGDWNSTDGSQTSEIELSSVTADATYTCSFSTDGTDLSQTVDVDVVTLTPGPTIALAGESVTLSCTLDGSDTEPTEFTWGASGATKTTDDVTDEAWNSADGSQVSKFTESIINATTDYECAVEIGDDTLTVTSITATVITLTSAGAVILEGSTSAVTLVCEMDNLPAEPTNIKWKDPSDNAIVNGSDYTQVDGSFDTDYQNTTLTIADASDYTSDQSFSCIFTVQGTSIGGSVVVDVVSITTTDSYKLDDVTATISCALGAVASDNSPTAVQWFKSSVEQTNSTSDITVYSADDFTSSQLESDADSTDATYTCKFTFATGTPESSVTVDVVTITTTHDHVAKDTAATVTCALTDSATEPTDVLWYLDSTLLSNGSSGYTIDEGTYDATNDNQTTTLTQASQGSSVTYTCTFEIGGYNISGNVDADVAEVTATGHTILQRYNRL
eukprot:sb/3461151/